MSWKNVVILVVAVWETVVWEGQLEVLTFELRTREREQASSVKNLSNSTVVWCPEIVLWWWISCVNFTEPQGVQIFG